MTVYVDTMAAPVGRMKMCHMLADTPEELFAMADKIGVDRKWYQGFNKASCPHFDIAQSKRKLAIAAGAVEADRRMIVDVMRRIRTFAQMCILARTRHGWEPPR